MTCAGAYLEQGGWPGPVLVGDRRPDWRGHEPEFMFDLSGKSMRVTVKPEE